MPLFSEQDNPASFSPFLLTRLVLDCKMWEDVGGCGVGVEGDSLGWS